MSRLTVARARDCATDPCDLCRRRDGAPGAPAFLANVVKDSYLCEGCWTDEERMLAEGEEGDGSAVELWREGTHGWNVAPHCDRCRRSLSVFVDGQDSQ